MKTFACMRSVKKVLPAIVIAFTVSIVNAQEFPPKHQVLTTTVNTVANHIYLLVAPYAHSKKENVYDGMNTDEEIILFHTLEQTGKTTRSRNFFKRRGSGEIRPLTLKNLKDEFANNVGFHTKLDVLAMNDFQLVKYRYCLNRIYHNSQMP